MSEVYKKAIPTNPFPGLRSFESEDASLFFGRDAQIRDLREKLANSRFLALVGSSGSGKSSLVKAGLIPQLVQSTQATGFTTWQVATFNPEATPIRNLAQALHQAFSKEDPGFSARFSPQSVEKVLLNEPDEVLGWIRASQLLVVIDQFEEIFRYQQTNDDRSEVAQFINVLLNFSQRPNCPVYVVLTMRSDYLDECTNYAGLTEAINRGYYLLPKMSREEIRQAITTPVSLMGARISDELTTRLLADIGDKADQLPIVQHALMRTWNHWKASRTSASPLDVGDYEAIGTMEKAISVHAEEVFAALPDEKSQLATEKVFKALILLGPGNTALIHPVSVSTLQELSGLNSYLLFDVLNRFREPGVAFLTPSTAVGASAELIIDVAHERILNLWERLQTWVTAETESAKLYKQVSQAALLYQEGKTAPWTNPELGIGLKWLAENRPTLAWANRYDPYLERTVNFLQYSRDQYDFEVQSKEDRQKKELRRARVFALFLGIGSLISLLFLIVSAVLRTQARQSEEAALAEKKIALFERNRAEEQTREAITQKKIAEQQGIIAEQQGRLTEEQRLVAVGEQRTAEEKRREAELARQMAVEQKQQAVSAKNEADQQRQQADGARKDAERQKGLADVSRQDAEVQRARAVVAQRYAEQQRGTAIARTVAIQSAQLTSNTQDELPALLALEAYKLNVKHGGQPDNPDVFSALSKAADAVTVLRQHTDLVRMVALPPGAANPLMASGSDDGTVKLWPANNPAQAPQSLGTPRKNADAIRTVVFSPDAKTVFGGSEKGAVYRWNTAQPEAAPVAVKAHTRPVQALLVTAEPTRLISISADGQLRSWKPTDKGLDSLQNVLTGYAVYCARISPNGESLFCGTNNGRVLRFNLANLKKSPTVYTRREFGNRVTALAFSPDGGRLITGTALGLVYAWDFANNEPEPTGSLLSGRHTSTVSDIAFSPNGKLLATASADWTIHLWSTNNLAQQQQPIIINDFDSWVMSIRFTHDSKRLIACGADKTIRIRNIATADLYADLTRKVTRNLTAEEWNKYIGKDIPYEKIKAE